MSITITKDGHHATLNIQGRMDTVATREIQATIDKLLQEDTSTHSVTLNASQLEYISSSGLRVLLLLAKRFKDFRVTETSPEVYQVLEMTGFSKIMPVEKALRRLSIKGCPVIGKGGVGTVYRIDDDTIIKVFRPGTTIGEVRTEITLSKEAFIKGMPTAISFDIVRVDNQYGLVYELLNADTMSTCVSREPERTEHYAKLYAQLLRQMHSIEISANDVFPDAKEHVQQVIRQISKYFEPEDVELMKDIADALPSGNRLLHCDLQPKNIMIQNDEPMLIDMGEVACGHPVIDLAHSYSPMMNLVGDYQSIIGLPQKTANNLWMSMTKYYFEGMTEEMLRHRIEQIRIISYLRGVTWLALSDSFPEDTIQQCRDCFKERTHGKRDYMLKVCESLQDW